MALTAFLKEEIRVIVMELYGIDAPAGSFDVSPVPENQPGQLGSNIAMSLAKALKKPPFQIGEAVSGRLKSKDYIEDSTVIKPGYTNITLKNSFYVFELKKLLASGDYFKNNLGGGKKVNIEFVSANPVGPLNIVSGRAAAYGDTLASIYGFSGFVVERETYVNDFGRQMHLFALSLMARYLQLNGENAALPEEGYQGEYVADIAKAMAAEKGAGFFAGKGGITDLEKSPRYNDVREFGLKYVLGMQKATLEKFGVKFDDWFSEASLHINGDVEEAFKVIESRGLFYEKEGAIWFKTTEFGDDKDRVVRKKDGDFTYFASDIAYVYNKIKRGTDLVVNILGPDHHGYVKRLESIMQGLGYEKERIKVIILQQVNLIEDGEKMKMSKRAGNFVSLDELLESVGRDAARYFFIMRSFTSHLDFDLALAREASDKNPVFYVQYAYARLCNIFEKAKEAAKPDEYISGVEFVNLEKEEKELILAMLMIPQYIMESAERDSPNWLTQAIHSLAGTFHTFYAKHRVVQDDRQAMLKRLYILTALKKTFEICFSIIGITPREKM